MPRVGFEPTISAGERPKTYALDRAATGTIEWCYTSHKTHLIALRITGNCIAFYVKVILLDLFLTNNVKNSKAE